jgi:signal transduction histidine kinase
MKLRLPQGVPFRLRIFFRAVFLLLALATIALTLSVLREEKQQSAKAYQEGVRKSHAQIVARLRHPTGQLALLNPTAAQRAVVPLRPLVLPFSAIDLDDKNKAQQAVEMAGCLVQYPDASSLCVGVGNAAYAGAFLYIAGSFGSDELVAHTPGDLDFSRSHRVRIEVQMAGETLRWIAPLEWAQEMRVAPQTTTVARARLAGFADIGTINAASRPQKDFRGWLWQDGRCFAADATDTTKCLKRAFLSVRVPIDRFINVANGVWPPEQLNDATVRVEVLPPGDAAPLFDSDTQGASRPFSWEEITQLLLPGERLSVRAASAAKPMIELVGTQDTPQAPRWIERLLRALPLEAAPINASVNDTIVTSLGRYEIALTGDPRSVDARVADVASRVLWFIAAMLGAIALAWLALEMRIIRRITTLTKRAATVSSSVRAADDLARIDLSDLRGSDELGVLARGLQDLVRRVKEDVKREQIRTDQEKNTWHAVGHEIMSPLQSLMVLHPNENDPSHRYISRMQQAVKVLYGQASPSEALQSAAVDVQAVDINAFLAAVARNAEAIGVDHVVYAPTASPIMVRADEYALEDCITHVLHNAQRYRIAGSPIAITLEPGVTDVGVIIHNQGPAIAEDRLQVIFEYGVSDAPRESEKSQRGQGLFVAKTYLAKMGGTISAHNEREGVAIRLKLLRA